MFGLLLFTLTNGFVPFFSVGILVIFNDVKSLWKEDTIFISFQMTYGDLTILGTYASSGVIAFLGTIFLFEGCCITC